MQHLLYIYHRPQSSLVSLLRHGGTYLSSGFNVFYFRTYGFTLSTLGETSDGNRMRRVQRLSKVGLLRLMKSHVPLHCLEDICGFPQSRSLSVQANMACLEDLTYLYSASDLMSNYVEQLVSQHQPTNKFRAGMQDLSSPRTNIPKGELVYHL